MPIYEYQCNSCEHRLEKLQKINDPPLTACPACDELSLKKLVSAAAFRLKGSGWYETDFKTGSKKNVSGDSHATQSGSTGSDSSSSEGKSSSVSKSDNSSKPEKVSAAAD